MKLKLPIIGMTREGSLGVVNYAYLEFRRPRPIAWLKGESRLFPWVGAGAPREKLPPRRRKKLRERTK